MSLNVVDPKEELSPQPRHDAQAALELQVHGDLGLEAFSCPESEEGYHDRRVLNRHERGRPVHAPRLDAERGAEGVPVKVVRLRPGAG